jgi:hypothetical protein
VKTLLFLGARTFALEIGPSATWGPARCIPHGEAATVLRRMAEVPENTGRLRRLLAEAAPGSAIQRLDDGEVRERVVELLLSARAVLTEGPAPAALRGLDGDAAEDAPGPPSSARGVRTWIEIMLIGEDEMPIPGEAYRIELPDGSVREGTLDQGGLARVDGIDPGTCTVTFPALDRDAWRPIGSTGTP